MHGWTEDTEELAKAVLDYTRYRLHLDPVPLDGPATMEELSERAGQTITEDGLGGKAALRCFAEVLAPACVSIDHPRYLSFIPCAPTEAATLFDLVVGASSIYGGSWLEGSGAVYAENQALRWLAALAGLPSKAGGVFVQGGTNANLSALVAARHTARASASRAAGEPQLDGGDRRRWAIATSSEAHSSIRSAAAVMDADVIEIEPDADGRLTGALLAAALERHRASEAASPCCAVVACAGTTNLGIVDDLASIAEVAGAAGIWLHVDAAYGGAALAAPSARQLFAGIERADSFVVDPHKWLFAPFDCAALLYRDPELARVAHVQHAGYLEATQIDDEWNPSDYAIHLTRRARGLPFWFSLAAYGTAAYTEAVETTLSVTRHAARTITERDYLELIRAPDLSVVAFRRLGWDAPRYYAWSKRLREAGVAFVVPTTVSGETVARLAVINPRTTKADIDIILDSMA